MEIWGALAVPIACAFILYLKYQRRTVFWEYLLPFIPVLAIILLGKFTSERVSVQDWEFWGGWGVSGAHNQAWNKRVPCQHPEYITVASTCTNADGSTYSCTTQQYIGDEHPYDVKHIPVHSVVTDSNGIETTISKAQFDELVKLWGEPMFIDLDRDFHTIDGDRYYVQWDKNPETFVPVTTKHAYENRVQGKNDLIKWEEVTDEVKARYSLYDYPPILENYKQRSVLGVSGSDADMAEFKLSEANAKLGRKHQVRMFVMVFRNQPEEAGYWQEQYLSGGNKNELISLIGVDSQGNVTWSRVVSWTEREDLKRNIEDDAHEYGRLELVRHVDYMISQVEQDWERKEFEDFSLVKVSPPLWVTILTYALSALGCLILSVWIVMNQHNHEPKRRSSWRY